MKIKLNINDDTNRSYIVLDRETIYSKSSIYKLPYDEGTHLYESLIKIAWEEVIITLPNE